MRAMLDDFLRLIGILLGSPLVTLLCLLVCYLVDAALVPLRGIDCSEPVTGLYSAY